MTSAHDTLPDEVAGWVGETRYPETANFPVERGYVWTSCASVENGNPLFWDDRVADELTGGPIAPPTTLSLWFRPHAWEPGEVSQRLPLQVHFDLKERLALPEAVMTESEVVLAEPVRPGDVISTAQVLRSVSPPKPTKLGTGRFWVIDVEYRNQDGTLVGIEIFTGFGYVRRGGREALPPPAPPSDSPFPNSHRRDDTAGWLTVDDVSPGEVLAPLDHRVTATTVVLGALATRDWRPMHHDVDFAVNRNGAKDIFLNTPNQQAWFERYLTDWSGPRGRLGRLRFRMRESVYPGDTMRLAGTVTAVTRDEGNCGWVDLDLSLQAASGPPNGDDGPADASGAGWRTCTTGHARIALPTPEIPNPWTLGSDSWNP